MNDQIPQRLEELILYVTAKMQRDHHAGVGRIKLAKLLWRIDFTAYWQLGHPITEATYQADQYGPSPVEELLATRDLEGAGRFRWEQDWDQRWMPVILGEPNDVFEADEIDLIDDVIDRYRSTSGRQMVEDAHQFPGWLHAWRGGEGKGATVPYESIFWDRRDEVRPDEDEHAAEIADEFAHLLSE
jgi:uncharacterized phage-associated protein